MVDSVHAGVQAEGAVWQIPPYLGSFYHPDARLYPANEIRLSEGRKERSVVLEALPIAPAQVVCGASVGDETHRYHLANLPNVATVAV